MGARAVRAAFGLGLPALLLLAPALAAVSHSLKVTPGRVVMAFSIYAAFYAASVPLLGKLADVRGYKLVYGSAMALFAAGSAVAALAPSLEVLIAGRVLQGIGGGGLFPVAQALVGATVEEERQGRVLGVLLGVFAVGAVVGPNLGGLLTQVASWRWIFWLNVPLAALGVFLLLGARVPEREEEGAIDWLGAGLVALSFGGLVVGIESLRAVEEHGFFSLRVAGVFVLTLAAFAVLAVLVYRTRDLGSIGVNDAALVTPDRSCQSLRYGRVRRGALGGVRLDAGGGGQALADRDHGADRRGA